jgi:hypothetical protein
LKIYDKNSNRVMNSVTIYLTPAEAQQLGDFAKQLALHPEDHHAHISNPNESVEVTIAVYTRENINQFDVVSRNLLQDEI